MSTAIRYDALLVRDLARELDRLLGGSRLDAAFLDRERLRVTLRTRARHRRDPDPPSLLWQLHPDSGHLTVAPDGDGGGRVQLGTPTVLRSVHAPPDERLLVIELDAPDPPTSAARRIVIELVTNQWNAVAIGGEERIMAVLRERAARGLRAGAVYEPPARSTRIGAASPVTRSEWRDALGDVPPDQRLIELQRRIAFTSALNAAFILGDAGVNSDEAALDRAHERYIDFVWRRGPDPVLLAVDGRPQPYPRGLASRGSDAGTATSSLVDAFALAATQAAAEPIAFDETDRALAALAQRLEANDRKASRLRNEQDGARADAQRMRRDADLLLAQLHRVERGATQVELDDFVGGTVRVELDPALSPADNATRLYDSARKRDRAARRIPALLRTGEEERIRLERLVERIRSGAATAEELARIRAPRRSAREKDLPALPYREYRTSGGHEVRVGRGSRANDDLTFRHSAPTDIWLHARDVAGAHVILRWSSADENPPAAAIAEAAVLAALYSRARTSGTVAVDWTRRKYVRKPRKSAPGLVVPERVRSVFVEPDVAVEERMRVDR